MKRFATALAALLLLAGQPSQAQMNMLTGAGGKFRAAPAGFDPLSLSPFVYYQVNRSTVYQSNSCTGTQATSDGDPVGCITDLGSAGFNLVSAADDTTRPTYHPNSGKPYITFDGSNDCLRSLNTIGLYPNGTFGIVAAFASASASPSAGQYTFAEGSGASANPVGGWINTVGGGTQASWLVRNDAGSTIVAAFNVAAAMTGASVVYGLSWDGSNITPYLAGSAGTNRAMATGSTMTINRFSVGCLVRTTTAGFFAGNFQAIFVKKATLSAGNMTSLNTYFAGIQ